MRLVSACVCVMRWAEFRRWHHLVHEPGSGASSVQALLPRGSAGHSRIRCPPSVAHSSAGSASPTPAAVRAIPPTPSWRSRPVLASLPALEAACEGRRCSWNPAACDCVMCEAPWRRGELTATLSCGPFIEPRPQPHGSQARGVP